MEINELLSIGIVGALLSVVIQAIKNFFGTDSLTTKIITIVLSIVVGFLYVYVRESVWWQTAVVVLSSASTVYALFFK